MERKLFKMSFRRRLKNKRVPEGFEMIEDVIDDFEQQMREAVNEEHEGKRKNEGNWKIHRLHWEKNRFIFDLMYTRKVMSRELVRSLYVFGDVNAHAYNCGCSGCSMTF